MKPIRVIMFSFERGFFDKSSDASARLQSLASDEMRISVVVLSAAHEKTGWEDGKVRVSSLRGGKIWRWVSAIQTGIKEVRRARGTGEDIVLTAQDPFGAGFAAFLASRFTGTPYEVQEHADYFSGFWKRETPIVNPILAFIGRRILKRADSVRVVSERIRDRLVRFGVNEDRIRVIPVSQEDSIRELVSRDPRPWPEVPVILVPCRFVHQKGLDVLVRALKELKQSGLKFRVRLVGAGPLRTSIQKQIDSFGLSDIVTIEQWSSREELWNHADLFVLSSRYEGWGRTIAEAMAARVPIVTTDVGCVGSFLRPQFDGRVVQPNDAESLARAIREQFEESERREWMVQNAFERAREFSSQKELVFQQHESWRAARDTESKPSRRGWVGALAVMGFVAAVRAISVIMFWPSLGANREWGFFILVKNWFLGYGYSFVSAIGCASAYRSPGYLFFLTANYGLFGYENFLAQAIVQNLFAVLAAYMVYRLGWAITRDRRVGLLAAVITALHPYTFYHFTQYYHTAISSFFLIALLWALTRLDQTRKFTWAFWSGIFIAGLAYIQGTILPATFFIAIWIAWRWWPDVKRAVIAVAIMAVVSAGLIAPWSIRNWSVFHEFVPLTTDLGHALAKANNENIYALTALGYPQEVATSEREFDPEDSSQIRYILDPVAASHLVSLDQLRESYLFDRWHPAEPGDRYESCSEMPMTETEFNRYWTGHASTWIRESHWTEVVKLQVQKIKTFWSPALQPGLRYGSTARFWNQPGILPVLASASLFTYVLLLELLAVAGLIVVARRKELGAFVPLLIVLAVYTVMHSFFAGYTKYRIPLDHVLAILAAVAVIGLYDRRKLKHKGLARLGLWYVGMDLFRKVGLKILQWYRIFFDRIKANWKIWLPTVILMGAIGILRIVSLAVFWEYAARIGDPGFKILVDHWFRGFGYSFAPDFGCLSSYRSPGYLLFITGVYLLFGFENYFALLFVQALVAIFTAYLLFHLTYALTKDRWMGWIVLAIYGLNPYTFYHYTQFYHTVLSSFFLALLIFGIIRLEQSKRIKWAIVTGIGIGCLALLQGTILPATPFLSLWILLRWRKQWRKALWSIGVMAIVSVAIIAPWTYRNWRAFHQFVPLTTDLGFALYKSNNDYSYGLNYLGYPQEMIGGESIINPENPLEERYFIDPGIEAQLREHDWYVTSSYITEWHPRPPGFRDQCTMMSTLNEPDFSKYWMDRAFLWMYEHPKEFLRLFTQKIVQFWSPTLTPKLRSGLQWPFQIGGVTANLAMIAHTGYMVMLELLSLLGLVLVVRRRWLSRFAPMIIIFGVYTLMHSLFAGYTKYRIPLDHLLAVLAAAAIIAAWRAWRKKS